MPGVHEQPLAGREVALDQFAGEVEPDDAGAADLLQDEAVAAKEARANPLLPGDFEADHFCATRNVSLRQISDWPACNCAGTIVPESGREGDMAGAVGGEVGDESDPPPNVRAMPARKPPPVWVFIVT